MRTTHKHCRELQALIKTSGHKRSFKERKKGRREGRRREKKAKLRRDERMPGCIQQSPPCGRIAVRLQRGTIVH